MRDIKFRAWDKSKQQMLDWVYFATQHSMGVFLDGDKYFALMQYTGLKDKNGVEIYEGDIVRVWLDTRVGDETPHNFEVKWSVQNASFEVYDELLCSWLEQDLEVIGNIYENKELLK